MFAVIVLLIWTIHLTCPKTIFRNICRSINSLLSDKRAKDLQDNYAFYLPDI